MRRLIVFTLAGLFVVNVASASLIGDEVDASLSFGEMGNNAFASPAMTTDLVTATVGMGVEFTGGISGTFTLDLDEASGVFAIANEGDLTAVFAPGILLFVDDLDWIGEPGTLTGLDNLGGALAAFVAGTATTSDSFLIEFGSITIPGETVATLTFDLVTQHGTAPVVPEPATAAMLVVGLAGYAIRARYAR